MLSLRIFLKCFLLTKQIQWTQSHICILKINDKDKINIFCLPFPIFFRSFFSRSWDCERENFSLLPIFHAIKFLLIKLKESSRRSKLILPHALHYFLSLSLFPQLLENNIMNLKWIWIKIFVMCYSGSCVNDSLYIVIEDRNDSFYGLIGFWRTFIK